jgi:hypothetical protein
LYFIPLGYQFIPPQVISYPRQSVSYFLDTNSKKNRKGKKTEQKKEEKGHKREEKGTEKGTKKNTKSANRKS